MACKCAKFDANEGRYYCNVSGDQCIYLIPNSKRCAEDYGRGQTQNIQKRRLNYGRFQYSRYDLVSAYI